MPCRACYERGDASSCRRQQSHRSRRNITRNESIQKTEDVDTSQNDISAKLDKVLQRLERVESVLGLQQGSERRSTSISDDDRQVKENGLVSAMEEAALGVGENRRWKGAALVTETDNAGLSRTNQQWFTPTSLSSCLATDRVSDVNTTTSGVIQQ
ncbi:hypothetical protein NXS19_008284 [Fusarium pseudograminearum]|nr:hypothetical protein NXS19_008284 [Fusarium pseudograminearum]